MTPPTLLRRELLPICWWIGGMVGLALLGGAALRLMNAVWIGLYLGIAGTVLIFGASAWSFGRHDFTWATQNGMPLGMHKRIMLIGTLLVLVHAGFDFLVFACAIPVFVFAIAIVNGDIGHAEWQCLERSSCRSNNSQREYLREF